MPVFEFKCPKCNKQIELFVKNNNATPVCKECGTTLERVYSGKMYGATGCKSGACSGNCASCKGCK